MRNASDAKPEPKYPCELKNSRTTHGRKIHWKLLIQRMYLWLWKSLSCQLQEARKEYCFCNFPSALWLTRLGDGICVRITVGLTDYSCSIFFPVFLGKSESTLLGFKQDWFPGWHYCLLRQGGELEEKKFFFLTFSPQQLLKMFPWRILADKMPSIQNTQKS